MPQTLEEKMEYLRRAQRAQAEKGVRRLSPAAKHSRKPLSLRLAVSHYCWDCSGGDSDPGVAWRIGNCEVGGCPLHPVRPHQRLLGRPAPRSLMPAKIDSEGDDV